MSLAYVGPPLVAFLAHSVLLLLVLRVRSKQPLHRAFATFLALMALWGLLIFGLRTSPTRQQALLWEQLVLPVFPLLAASLLHFVLLLRGVRGARLLLVYLAGFPLALAAPSPAVLADVTLKPYGYAPVSGPLFLPWIALVYVMFLLALGHAFRAYRESTTADRRNRSLYILLGVAIGLAGGLTDYLASVERFPYPLGIVGNIVFAALATTAVVRHRLLEIEVYLRRSLAYTLISGLLILLYVGLVLLADKVLQVRQLPQVLNFVLVVLVAVGLHPLLRRAQELVDRWVFRERYHSLEALRQFSRHASNIIDLERLVSSLVELTQRAMGARHVHLLLYNPEQESLALVASTNLPSQGAQPFYGPHPLLALTQQEEVTTRHDLEFDPRFQGMPLSTQHAIQRLEGELFVPLRSEGRTVGLLVVGPRRTPQPYTAEDVSLLVTVATQAALAAENARLYAVERNQVAELARLDQAKTDFFLTAAHQLKTPLTSLRVAVGVLEELAAQRDPREAHLVGTCARAVDTLEAEIVELLEFLKVKTRGVALNPAPERLEEVVQEAVEEVAPLAEAQQQALEVRLPQGLPFLRLDRAVLRKVLVNLLHNACKFTPPGGRVTVEAQRADRTLLLRVADTGPGVPPEERRRIFDAYYQVKDTQRRRAGRSVPGSGLGLAIVKSLVELHGGRIWVESAPGGGACFVFSLLLDQGAGGRRPGRHPARRRPPGGGARGIHRLPPLLLSPRGLRWCRLALTSPRAGPDRKRAGGLVLVRDGVEGGVHPVQGRVPGVGAVGEGGDGGGVGAVGQAREPARGVHPVAPRGAAGAPHHCALAVPHLQRHRGALDGAIGALGGAVAVAVVAHGDAEALIVRAAARPGLEGHVPHVHGVGVAEAGGGAEGVVGHGALAHVEGAALPHGGADHRHQQRHQHQEQRFPPAPHAASVPLLTRCPGRRAAPPCPCPSGAARRRPPQRPAPARAPGRAGTRTGTPAGAAPAPRGVWARAAPPGRGRGWGWRPPASWPRGRRPSCPGR